LKHPIVAWGPGLGAYPEAYRTYLEHLASHGFVTLAYNTTADGPALTSAIDWLIAENEREGSDLYGKLDPDRVAAGGHSAGSLGTYQMADDPRLKTTLHMSGGSMSPTIDVPKLRNPALMVCGDAALDVATPMCETDFEMAKVPVFYGMIEGAEHPDLNDAEAILNVAGTEPNDPVKLLFIKATVGWLRWQLADDVTMKPLFVGSDCGLCSGTPMVVKQKDLQ